MWNLKSFILFVFLTCSIRKNSHQNAGYWEIKTGLKVGPKGIRFANLNVYALFGPEKLQFRGSGGVNVFLRVSAPPKAHGEVHAMLIAALLSPIIMSAWHLKILSPIQVKSDSTFRASLSGTFLQTLPDLATPLKGHSVSPRSCPQTRSAPSERFGVLIWLWKQPSAQAPM